MVLLDVFIADVADEDELKTGSRRRVCTSASTVS